MQLAGKRCLLHPLKRMVSKTRFYGNENSILL